jgi:hypothetical protein
MIKYSKTKKIRNEALSRLDHFRFFGDSNLFRISCFDIRISASTLFPHHRISTPEASRRLAGGANHRTNTKMRTSPGGATEWAPRNFRRPFRFSAQAPLHFRESSRQSA